MPVLVTCKFDKYLIKGDWEKLETSFVFTTQGPEKKWRHHDLHYKDLWGKNSALKGANSKVYNPIRPKFELGQAFMPVLVTCKFDKDPIKGDWEKLDTSFFHRSRARNSKITGQIQPKFELVRDFMPALVTCKFDEDWIHSNWEKMETPFSPFKINGNAQDR